MKPGQAFEQSLLASLPRRRNPTSGKLETNPRIFHRKSPTPPRPAPVRELVNETRALRAAIDGAGRCLAKALLERGLEISKAGLGEELAPRWVADLGAQHSALLALLAEPEWIDQAERFGSSFTPGAGVDLVITAPAAHCANPRRAEMMLEQLVYSADGSAHVRAGAPVIHFSIECKSVAGKSLPFGDLRDEQARILRLGRAAGHVAGIAIEFRNDTAEVDRPRECHFVLIDAWDRHEATATRKSLSLAEARQIGVRIEEDSQRGVTATYWRMGEFLAHFGAEV